MSDETFRNIIVAIIYITIFSMIALATSWTFSVFLFLSLTGLAFWMIL